MKQFKISWEKLDQTALDIEFLLISVVQGVALATLSSASVGPFSKLQLEYFPYILTAFILILAFWSGAIIHSLSFIHWPLDMYHNFFYFLASFIEVIAFNQINNPLMWFVFMLIFQIVAGGLYLYDLNLIKGYKKEFEQNFPRKRLYEHILKAQLRELKIFVPLTLIFNALAFLLIFYLPNLFINNHFHLILISLQAVVGVIFLINSIKNYKIRAKLITACINYSK